MRRGCLVASAAVLLIAPGAALAQSGATSEPPSATNMKGSPNASGYGKDTGMDKGSTLVGGAGSQEAEPSAKNLKGSPNSNGFKQ